ncbi:phage tail tube protein [uncultured Roseobacter sp.]|uniref:phage tail tube protein n=1 Tax=uncultured Roseobacter sp. TaxID=114847 RepID=UPI002628E34F|nr:phage tail tube protein [uncultured Roseobacter sp.]
MAQAVTQKYEELVLQVETSTPGQYATICGLIDVEISRTANLDTVEIPDCDDESLPLSVEKQVRNIEISASGTGVWAQSSHETLMDWFYSSATKNIRIGNLNASVGDTEYETGPAILTDLSNSRTKGQKVTASISIEFDGTPVRSAKA